MAGYLTRLFLQVGISAVQVTMRSFIQAYQIVVMKGRAGANAAVTSNLASKISGKIDLDEAGLILNVKENMTREEYMKNFDFLFDSNMLTKGGSFYLQSKIYRAHQALLPILETNWDELSSDCETKQE